MLWAREADGRRSRRESERRTERGSARKVRIAAAGRRVEVLKCE